jgi:hypothetical protein
MTVNRTWESAQLVMHSVKHIRSNYDPLLDAALGRARTSPNQTAMNLVVFTDAEKQGAIQALSESAAMLIDAINLLAGRPLEFDGSNDPEPKTDAGETVQ